MWIAIDFAIQPILPVAWKYAHSNSFILYHAECNNSLFRIFWYFVPQLPEHCAAPVKNCVNP
jgi:hypothetical protein